MEEQYGADPDQVSVSGLSAGGFMAVQVHVAYSASIMGVGVIAGGPYYCARGNLFYATTSCMSTGNINVDYLVDTATPYALLWNSIDDPENMEQDKIYIFHSSEDSVVVQDVGEAAEEYYRCFNENDANYLVEYGIASEHAIVTDGWGNACNQLSEPYINNCGYNTAYEMLNHIYGGNLELVAFDQDEFFGGNAATESVDDTGYVYVPSGCKTDASGCRVHIALHGCHQQHKNVGDAFTTNAGYNEVAELNNIIVIYPQTIASAMRGNPNACWDWWGYASISYACNLAPQMQFMKAIIDRVTS
ncbi:poly(3-hydroxybutyrate) depolymerase-like [Diadema antillarum]|uniref:poly(3-hydroxybutyrate) depolymerase-like n=1 Tax=Diadema antillarum TaxID=105358 RepID=UPI003A8596FC